MIKLGQRNIQLLGYEVDWCLCIIVGREKFSGALLKLKRVLKQFFQRRDLNPGSPLLA